MNSELLEALNVLEKEKNISKDTLLEAIEQSLLQACKNHFGKADNVKVFIDRSCIGHGNGYGNTGDRQRDEKRNGIQRD